MSRPQVIPARDIHPRHRGRLVVLYHFRQYLSARSPEWLLALTAHGYLAMVLFFNPQWLRPRAQLRGKLPGRPCRATSFYRLRFARIYPLHFVMLLLFLLNPLGNCAVLHQWRYFGLWLGLLRAEPVPGAELGLLERAGLE